MAHRVKIAKFDHDQTFAGRSNWRFRMSVLAFRLNFAHAYVDCMTVAARAIVELNIKHYRELLLSETDALRRRTIAKLLTEEETKLAKLLAEKSGDT